MRKSNLEWRRMFGIFVFLLLLLIHKTCILGGNPDILTADNIRVEQPITYRQLAPTYENGSFRVLVTGGAGFIGLHSCMRIHRQGHFVVAFDNVNNYYNTTLKETRIALLQNTGITFMRGDVCNTSALEETLARFNIDRVVHLAAQAGVRYSLKNPMSYVKNNVECFVKLLEVLKGKNILMVYASSSSVYGVNKRYPFSENDRVSNPVSLYAATKRANELLSRTYWNLYRSRSIGLRFFTVYGPYGRPDMAYYSFVKNIIEGKKIKMYNHGNCQRDFTYIDDITRGIVKCLHVKNATVEILNIGQGKPVQLRKFINIIEESLNKKAIIDSVGMQPGDVPITYSNTSKIKRMLNYTPSISLEEGIPKFVAWYKFYHGLPVDRRVDLRHD